MSIGNTYLPANDSERVSWINNISVKLPAYQTVLGLSAAEIAQVKQDSDMYAYTVNFTNIIKQTQQNATAYKNLLKHDPDGQIIGGLPSFPVLPPPPPAVPAGIFDRTRYLIQRIKNSPGYTNSIGQDLDIIAPVNAIDYSLLCPELKGKLNVGRPHLKWQKGVAAAVDLYADYNDGKGFRWIGRFLRKEFIDQTPIADGKVADEFRYKAVYVINDDQVGKMSQIFAITVLKH
ncbi:MAG TPA: hypothetical protein VGC65_09620 [Bacteroidia bacterium]|jgi:hypothetical protein